MRKSTDNSVITEQQLHCLFIQGLLLEVIPFHFLFLSFSLPLFLCNAGLYTD